MKRNLIWFVVVLIFVASIAANAAKLDIGSDAPPIKVSKWVHGAPFTKFEKGQIYVMEFWATWCGPCRQTIPHLTELAKKYKGKVIFAGINIRDNEDVKTHAEYVAKIAKFVKQQGDKMQYKVGLDDMKDTMFKTWMDASDASGIPTAFVVDKKGKIAAIAHPMELDEILEAMVDDKFDSAAYKKQRDEQKKAEQVAESIYNLINEGNFKEAIEAVDDAVAANPASEPQLAFAKLFSILQVDAEKGYTYARELADGLYKDDSSALEAMAATMIASENTAKNPTLGVYLAEKANKLNGGKDFYTLDLLGEACFMAEEIDKAIEYQQKAVELMANEKNINPVFKDMASEKLEKYKAKKKNP